MVASSGAECGVRWCSIEPEDAKEQTPFADVRLGPLVGKGSCGKVYRGIWDHMIVAIKVSHLFIT